MRSQKPGPEEASTTEISKKKKPKGLPTNQQIARQGGYVAGKARAEIEKQTGESVITSMRPHALPENISARPSRL